MKYPFKKFVAVMLVLIFSFSANITLSFSSESDPLDDILDGFDDESEPIDNDINDDILDGFPDDDFDEESTDSKKSFNPSRFFINGNFKIGTSYNFAHDAPLPGQTDWRGLSRLRMEARIDLETKIFKTWKAYAGCKGAYDFAYVIHDRDEYSDDVLDNYEKELDLRETYIIGSLTRSLDIKSGRQVVVWGKSDNIRVTDVLNPLDNREPGLTDLEDLRLPVFMTRLGYYIGKWNLSGIAVHEIRFDKNPEFGSDFYPTSMPYPHEDIPSDSADNTEYAASLSGIFSGWDVAFYWAYFFNDRPHVELKTMEMRLTSLAPLQIETITDVEMKHARLNMYGADVNAVYGSFLFKVEAAFFDGIRFFNYPAIEGDIPDIDILIDHGRKYSRIDTLVGIEYSGFKNTFISVEAVNRHLCDYKNNYQRFQSQIDSYRQLIPETFNSMLNMLANESEKNEMQTMISLSRDYLNDTLKLEAIASWYARSGGAFQRFSGIYNMTDSVEITGGAALYQSGRHAGFSNIDDNDRFYLEIKYSF